MPTLPPPPEDFDFDGFNFDFDDLDADDFAPFDLETAAPEQLSQRFRFWRGVLIGTVPLVALGAVGTYWWYSHQGSEQVAEPAPRPAPDEREVLLAPQQQHFVQAYHVVASDSVATMDIDQLTDVLNGANTIWRQGTGGAELSIGDEPVKTIRLKETDAELLSYGFRVSEVIQNELLSYVPNREDELSVFFIDARTAAIVEDSSHNQKGTCGQSPVGSAISYVFLQSVEPGKTNTCVVADNLKKTTAHELGHALGADHVGDDVSDLMYSVTIGKNQPVGPPWNIDKDRNIYWLDASDDPKNISKNLFIVGPKAEESAIWTTANALWVNHTDVGQATTGTYHLGNGWMREFNDVAIFVPDGIGTDKTKTPVVIGKKIYEQYLAADKTKLGAPKGPLVVSYVDETPMAIQNFEHGSLSEYWRDAFDPKILPQNQQPSTTTTTQLSTATITTLS